MFENTVVLFGYQAWCFGERKTCLANNSLCVYHVGVTAGADDLSFGHFLFLGLLFGVTHWHFLFKHL